jgi:hypothetical protein
VVKIHLLTTVVTGVLQVELGDFFMRFSEAGVAGEDPIGWVLQLRRGSRADLGPAFGSSIEFFTLKDDGWSPVPLSWEPT